VRAHLIGLLITNTLLKFQVTTPPFKMAAAQRLSVIGSIAWKWHESRPLCVRVRVCVRVCVCVCV